MHSAATLIAPLLAAEKSKVPFYIVGGLFAVWALTISLAIGLRRPAFPGGLGGERVVIAVSVVLALGALSTAVLTSSSPAKSAQPATAAPPPSATAPGAAPPPSATPASSRNLSIAANPTGLLAFNTKQLRAPSGRVTIAFTNASVLEHNLTIAEGSKVLEATPTFLKSTRSLSLNLKPGTYTFYCSVPGHRQAGMEGTLTVTP